MQPRSLKSILAELNTASNPSVKLIQQKQSMLPQALKAEEQGLAAKQTEAFGNILGGARQRGLGFSGIPLGEQARYTATEYMPALARLRQTGREQAMSLEEAINGIRERNFGAAQGIRQTELDRKFQFDEANRNRRAQAAAAAAFAPSFGMGSTGPSMPATKSTPAKPTNTLQSFLAKQYAAQPNAPRALQDQWVRQWAKATGKKESDPTIWRAYNTLYPWEKYNDNANRGSWKPNVKSALMAPNRNSLSLGNAARNFRDWF